jgi:hypothetical protein
MPKGDEEEIAGRGEAFLRFVALLGTRALLERPTLNPSFDSRPAKPIASALLIRPILIWHYANSCLHTRFLSRAHVFDQIVSRNVAFGSGGRLDRSPFADQPDRGPRNGKTGTLRRPKSREFGDPCSLLCNSHGSLRVTCKSSPTFPFKQKNAGGR